MISTRNIRFVYGSAYGSVNGSVYHLEAVFEGRDHDIFNDPALEVRLTRHQRRLRRAVLLRVRQPGSDDGSVYGSVCLWQCSFI